MLDVSGTILSKSDQLNASDLIGNEMILTVSNVNLVSSPDQPMVINWEGDDGRPYKPCKSMRRVLVGLWGKDASQWIGRSIGVYNEPTVKWAGKEEGGIRIKSLSHIDKNKSVTTSESQHKKITYLISVLQVEQKQRAVWPDDKFNDQLPRIRAAIEGGTSTAEKIITSLMGKADLTDSQISAISNFAVKEQTDDEFFNEGQ
jgi:predicted DNA binding protein